MIKLVDYIGEPALLELMAEEATEVAHAALKKARVLRGENPTPVTIEAAEDALEEECADFEICYSALIAGGVIDEDRVLSWFKKKSLRMARRLNEAEG